MHRKDKNALKLLIATKNPGKMNEFYVLLKDLPVKLHSLSEFANMVETEETGSTFEENAVLKACSYGMRAGILTLADDSGLEIEAIGNRPGVHSARYAGVETGYAEKVQRLLGELEETGDKRRRARFVSVIAIADELGELIFLAEGVCAGTIAGAPRGTNGFGYDPIFIPDGFGQTFGELSAEVKDQISHRARATAKIIRYLRDFTGV